MLKTGRENILLPHQIKAAGELRNGSILKGATGTGKTITALAYYADCEPRERLIVITTAKKRDSGDWEAEARLLAIFPEVDSWQNIDKYADVSGAFFIFDEQRVVGSGAWVKSFLKITKHNKWILLSATPGDTWLDYIPVFVANGFYKNRTDFLREHVVFARFARYPKVERILGTSKLAQLLSGILVEMPYEKKTVRHDIDVFCEHDREAYDVAWRRRWNAEEERPIGSVSELFSIIRHVVNGDGSRLRAIEGLLGKHPKLIIFYNFDYELAILREGLAAWVKTQNLESAHEETGENSGFTTAIAVGHGPMSMILTSLGSFAVAEWNGHKHEPIPETESWAYLVQYQAGSEGWNCFETDTVVFYSLTYSYRMWEQAHGRIDRIGTPYTDLYYYSLRSCAEIDSAIFGTLAKKKNFNERKFLQSGKCRK